MAFNGQHLKIVINKKKFFLEVLNYLNVFLEVFLTLKNCKN